MSRTEDVVAEALAESLSTTYASFPVVGMNTTPLAHAAITAMAGLAGEDFRASVERLMNAAWMNGEAVEGGRANEGADITESKREVLAMFAVVRGQWW